MEQRELVATFTPRCREKKDDLQMTSEGVVDVNKGNSSGLSVNHEIIFGSAVSVYKLGN